MVYESNEINLIKLQDGTDGKPGKDGESGKTLYTWVKYSQYADGTNLTDDPTDAVYIGIAYNKEEQTESNNKSDYTWSKIKGEDGYTPVKGVDYFDGTDGKNGTSSYIWIRYATDSSGSGMTVTPSTSTTYIGTATTTINTAPSSASDYKWSKYVGSDGIPGEKGDDGKTAYLHIAYANSADGKTGFDISNGTGKLYIGQYTDNISTDSTDPTKYTWTKIKGEDGINGTNGKDGTSITIKSTSITYQSSSSGTTTPTGTWSTSVPNVSNGQYLWTKTVVTYSDGTSTTAYSVAYKGTNGTDGKDGTDGTDGKDGTSYYTHIKYSANANGSDFVSAPTSSTTYIGVYTGTSSTAPTSASSYTWSKYVGDKGATGNGINSITYYYATTTTQTAPSASNITSTSIPTLSATNKYLWQKEVIDYTDSSVADKTSVTLLAVYGDTGSKGATGATGTGVSKVIPLYYLKSNTTAPASPTSAITSTSTSSGVWTTAIPTYVSGYTYFTCTQTLYTDGTYKWSTVVIDNGLTNANSNASSALSTANTANTTANTANNKVTYRYGTCSTAAATVAKVVTLSGFTLYTGATVTVYFTYANTASNPTLNVNGTGAKNIRVKNTNIAKAYYWGASDTVTFTYNGSYWVMSDTSANAILASWCYNNDKTLINGGNIATGTITADKINVNNLDAITANIGLWHIEDGKLVADITKSSIDDEYEILKHSVISYSYNSSGDISFRKQRDTVMNNNSIIVEYVESTNDRYTSELYPGATSQSFYDRYTKYSDNRILYLERSYNDEDKINVSANIIFDKVLTGRGYNSIIKLIADDIELDASNSANGVRVNGTFQADDIQTTSGANLDTINSNLNDCIKYLGTYTFAMTVQSTKSLGRGQEYTVTLDKNYPTARFGIINQDINGDWVIINLKAWKDAQHPVLTYQNFYSSALSGNVSIHIYGN